MTHHATALNLAAIVDHSARLMPDRVALTCAGRPMTYGQLNQQAERVAAALAAGGIAPGDHVALSCPNLPYFPIVYYGILKAGGDGRAAQRAAQGPRGRLPPRRLRREGVLLLRGHRRAADRRRGRTPASSEADGCEHFFLITADPAAPRPSRAPRRSAQACCAASRRPSRRADATTDDTAVILYTSGTTGQPKGAELHAPQHARSTRSPRDMHLLRLPTPRTATPTSARCRCSTPSARPCMMNAGFASAAPLVLLPRFEPAAASTLMDTRAGHLLGPACRRCTGRCSSALDDRRRRRAGRRAPCASRLRRRRRCRSRSSGVRGPSGSRSSRATASPRRRRSRASTSYDRPSQAGLGRAADLRRRDAAVVDDEDERSPTGERRRDRDPRATTS